MLLRELRANKFFDGVQLLTDLDGLKRHRKVFDLVKTEKRKFRVEFRSANLLEKLKGRLVVEKDLICFRV